VIDESGSKTGAGGALTSKQAPRRPGCCGDTEFAPPISCQLIFRRVSPRPQGCGQFIDPGPRTEEPFGRPAEMVGGGSTRGARPGAVRSAANVRW